MKTETYTSAILTLDRKYDYGKSHYAGKTLQDYQFRIWNVWGDKVRMELKKLSITSVRGQNLINKLKKHPDHVATRKYQEQIDALLKVQRDIEKRINLGKNLVTLLERPAIDLDIDLDF